VPPILKPQAPLELGVFCLLRGAIPALGCPLPPDRRPIGGCTVPPPRFKSFPDRPLIGKILLWGWQLSTRSW
jgi:hypothetical protein